MKDHEQIKQERTKRRETLLTRLGETLHDEHMADFVEYLDSLKFFNTLTDTELDYLEEDIEDFGLENFVQLVAKNNGIVVVIAQWDKWKYITVDPIECYDSPKRSSVHAYFPMSKREYNRFLVFFKKINGEDPQMRCDWMKTAPSCMWGEYVTFGE